HVSRQSQFLRRGNPIAITINCQAQTKSEAFKETGSGVTTFVRRYHEVLAKREEQLTVFDKEHHCCYLGADICRAATCFAFSFICLLASPSGSAR
ncbi:hypothetical protein CEXT_257681, partial [Caerostris extrusa]